MQYIRGLKMIDTIGLRLHDLNLHKDIYDFLMRQNFTTVHIGSKFLEWKEIENMNPTLQRDYIQYGDTGSEKTRALFGKIHVPSSHYNITYIINDDKEYIDFNLSIPKYLYGNNIAQFVRPVTEAKFRSYIDSKFMNQKRILFKRMIQFIDDFFEFNFPNYLLDKRKLEITRIDLCYNQVFPSKSEAMRFLNYQKKMNLRNMRIDGNTFQSYKTSFMYKNKDYSIKVYHKGTEYEKNDRVEHEKINKVIRKKAGLENINEGNIKSFAESFEGQKGLGFDKDISTKDAKKYYDLIRTTSGRNVFDTDLLKSIADRMLRYELTFRKPLISKVFKMKVFRKADSIYRDAAREFNEWFNRSRAGSKRELIPSDFLKTFEYLEKWRRVVLEPMRDLPSGHNERNFTGGIKDLKKIKQFKFDEDTLNEMVNIFRGYIMQFQVKYADSEETFINKLKNYNRVAYDERELRKTNMLTVGKVKKPKNVIRMRYVYDMLAKYGSWENIYRSGELSKSTFYRYMSEFRELGFEKNYISREIFNISTEFDSYYDLEQLYHKKLRPVIR